MDMGLVQLREQTGTDEDSSIMGSSSSRGLESVVPFRRCGGVWVQYTVHNAVSRMQRVAGWAAAGFGP